MTSWTFGPGGVYTASWSPGPPSPVLTVTVTASGALLETLTGGVFDQAIAQAAANALPGGGGTLTGALVPAVVPLAFGASIALNAALGNVFAVTLTASTGTLAAPSNPADGQAIRVRVIQGSGGGFTLAYDTAYDFGTAGAPTLSTAAAAGDELGFEYWASKSKWCYLGSGLGF